MYEEDSTGENNEAGFSAGTTGHLLKIPGSREDVFQNKDLDLQSARSLMKFLKVAADRDAYSGLLGEWGEKSFPEFLSLYFGIPSQRQSALLALTASLKTPKETLASYALPRVHRHLTSTGLFGPGFSSVIPKWGGLAEIAQVACRASAVGGGVYILKEGIKSIKTIKADIEPHKEIPLQQMTLYLQGGDKVKAHWVVGTSHNLPSEFQGRSTFDADYLSRSISILSSPLTELFPAPSEGVTPSSGVVVVFPTGSLHGSTMPPPSGHPPVYLTIHSSDTGECPDGQCESWTFPWLVCCSCCPVMIPNC